MTMYARFGQAAMRYWQVELHAQGKHLTNHEKIGVVARTADEVVDWVSKNKTDRVLVSVHYIGPVDNIT